jgi:UrcA family protein
MYAAKEFVIDRPKRRPGWIPVVVTAGVSLCSAGSTLAETATTVTQHAVVRVSKLDPASRSDAERLYRAIERAAEDVCGSGATRVLRQWQAQRACAAEAVARAVEQVDSPVLTAVHFKAIDRAGPERTARLDDSDRASR